MKMSKQIKIEDWNLLNDFKKKCLNNRAFFHCDFLDELSRYLNCITISVSVGTKLYRARTYSDKPFFSIIQEAFENNRNSAIKQIINDHSNGFRGYNSKDSFVNSNYEEIDAGRCNNKFEPVLYVAENEKTAIMEVKPLIGEEISVATINVDKELKLIDFRFNMNYSLIDLTAFLFLDSYTRDNHECYVYTQAICSFIKNLGYDGVVYSSCQNRFQSNYAIFTYNNCHPICSDLYKVEELDIKYEKISKSKGEDENV